MLRSLAVSYRATVNVGHGFRQCAPRSSLQSRLSSAAVLMQFTRPFSKQSLPSTMKAQVLTQASHNNWQMSLETLKMPVPKAGEVLVRVRACGVCHTDLHVMKKEVAFPIPAVMGHEISGTIVGLGDGVDSVSAQALQLGQPVVCPFIMPCGTCHYCVRGKEDICDTFFAKNRLLGTLYDGQTRLFRLDGSPVSMYSMGGLAEYCVVPATAVFPIPAAVSSVLPHADASIIGCAIFTAYGAVRHAGDIRAGETVAVIGAGGVGSSVLQFAKAFGASQVIAIDVSDEKLAAVKKLGASHTINAKKVANVADAIKSATGGRGVDVCVEALGRRETFLQAVQAVQDGGRAVMVGIAPAGMTADVEITRIVRRQIRIIGSYGAKARQDVPDIFRFVANGSIDVSGAITKRFTLETAGQAYTELDKGQITGRAIVVVADD